jgi:hypothetical protein
VAERAVLDDLDQLDVLQHGALGQDGVRHLDIVVGEDGDEIGRRAALAGQPFGQRPALAHFDVVDQVAEDVGHDRPLGIPQHGVGVEEQVADDLDEPRPAFERAVARERHQLVEIDLLGGTHGYELKLDSGREISASI